MLHACPSTTELADEASDDDFDWESCDACGDRLPADDLSYSDNGEWLCRHCVQEDADDGWATEAAVYRRSVGVTFGRNA